MLSSSINWLYNWWDAVEITPENVVLVICVLFGALILTNYTRISGIVGFLLNAIILFAGASIANYLGAELQVPFDFLIEKTLLVTIAGMLASSFAVLLLFPRSRQG